MRLLKRYNTVGKLHTQCKPDTDQAFYNFDKTYAWLTNGLILSFKNNGREGHLMKADILRVLGEHNVKRIA
jgi:hypothetical protein